MVWPRTSARSSPSMAWLSAATAAGAAVGGGLGETSRRVASHSERTGNGRPHTVAALAYRRVRQADHGDARQSACHVDFHRDWNGVDAEDGRRGETREHARSRASPRPTEIRSDLLKSDWKVAESAMRGD